MQQAIPSLLSDFPRGDPDRAPTDDNPRGFKPPAAAFTKPAMMRDRVLSWESGKFFLGVMDGTVETDPAGYNYVMGGRALGVSDNRHVCTFAGNRAGKGRACIIPNLLDYPGSILATDPKGELAIVTARRRVALGQNVHVLDPFGVTKRGYPGKHGLRKGFNPILAMRDDSLVEDAALISDALVVAGGKDPHWDEAARAFIEGLILHIRTSDAYKDQRSLLTLRELIDRAGGRIKEGDPVDDLQDEMNDNPAADGVIQSAAADFFDKPPNERGNVLSNARRHLKFIDLFRRPEIRPTLETHSFELDDLKTKAAGTTIYLCLPARLIGVCNRWLRLFVNLMLQSMERTRVSALPGNVPVLCALDEFAVLGHMKQLEDAAGQIAGFGVKLWPILQDLGQLKSLYSERWETFLGNAGIVQFFGNNDLTTLEWISRRCGKTSIETVQRKNLAVEEGGTSISIDVHDLLTLDEAARYFGRDDPKLRQLVIWAGRKNPLLVMQRAYYDKHALFRPDGLPLFDEIPDE